MITLKDGICFYCGKRASMNKDHVIPKSKGGRFIVKTCFECNNLKSNYSLFEFYMIDGITKEKFLKINNFVKQTRSHKEYDQLFSIGCFESKIKNGYFLKLVSKYPKLLELMNTENQVEQVNLLNNEICNIHQEEKVMFKLKDYFVHIHQVNKKTFLTQPRIDRYKKLLNTNKSLLDELSPLKQQF